MKWLIDAVRRHAARLLAPLVARPALVLLRLAVVLAALLLGVVGLLDEEVCRLVVAGQFGF
jgi:hypothetical protein